MAGFSLFRVGTVWHYRFYAGGRRVQKTTRETSRAKAAQIADKAYERAKIIIRGDQPIPTLKELVEQWIAAHTLTASSHHIRAVEIFGRLHLYGLEEKYLDEIRTVMVEEAQAKHLEKHAPASVNHWLFVLKLLFGWAVRRELISRIPFNLSPLKVQKVPRPILPAEKASQWLAAVDTFSGGREWIPVCVRLMLGLGLRISEALSARWEWVDFERRIYTPGITKGREADPIPMTGWVVELLYARAKDEGLIVLTRKGKTPDPQAVRRAMQKANEICGTPGLTPHRLRGTFATMLSGAGVPVQDIQRVMRHKEVKTTMGYLETNLALVAKGMDEVARKMGFMGRSSESNP